MKIQEDIPEIETNQEKPPIAEYSYPKWLKFLCYLTAIISLLIIAYILTGLLSEITNSALKKLEINFYVTRFRIYSYFAAIFTFVIISRHIGDNWRSNDRAEIGTSVTNFKNFFFDPSFKKNPTASEYSELRKFFIMQKAVIKDLQNKSKQLVEINKNYETKIMIHVRHNDNANRLLDSFNYYVNRNENFVDKLLRDTLTECVTVLQRDLNDKSISLFEVKENQLVIREYSRISALSAATRTFKKGEGFAGSIWEKNRYEIVNQIDSQNDLRFKGYEPRHRFKAIVGIPLSIEDVILGVLCIQSENEDGFNESDVRTLEFYARICTLLLQYDKINNNQIVKEEFTC